TSADPHDIENLLQGDWGALPYLKDALLRHLQQFPSVRNGLNRLKNQILAVVASGIRKLGPIFDAVSKKEERPFFGDTSLWRCINQLASGNESLLRVSGPDSLSELTKIKPGPEPDEPPSPKKLNLWDVDITEEGKAVLAGNQDAIRLNGIDKWIGGVHLQGAEAAWRWDEEPGKIVQIAVSQTVFKNWKALKESVNSSQLTKSGLQAEHGRVWIEGVPDGEVGGAWDMLLKGMEILLKYRGERTGLNELMAYSGDAFHLCHSSTWQEMAYMMIPTDTLANVVKVYGYEGEWLYFPPSPKTPGTERKTYEILGKLWADIDAGHPVMIGGCADKGCGPWSVVVGYDRSKMQMCHIGIGESYRWTGIRGLDYDLNPEDGKCGFWNGRLRGKLGGRTGGWLDNLAYRLGGKTNAPSQKEGVVSTLKRAVELFSASPFFLGSSGAFNFYYGGEAYQQWATALRQLSYPDDLKKPRSKDAWGQYDMGNMDTQVDQIVRGRAAAAEFCERATEQFPIAKDRLTAAAKLYREEVNIAREAFRVFIPLWDGNDKPREAWFSDKAQRDAGADSILRMLEKEKSAIIEIEKALAMIE
ncbi:MAG: hypothetical protein L6437_10090, partial [Kiritimatiellae bacterium]|nr:hypothetical protein [Kiritimatiellia bacterium]